MGVRFRVWMPLVAVFMVLLTVASVLVYVLPVAGARLKDYGHDHALGQAAAAADELAGKTGPGMRRSLDDAADRVGGEALVMDEGGRILATSGPELLAPNTEAFREVASRDRIREEVGNLWVAKVPIVHQGELTGGAVVVYEDSENPFYRPLVISGLEAAAFASSLGGGVMLLLAALLSRRVGRLSSGARSMERGDLSARIEPGYGDELGELARNLNSMAASLQRSFGLLAEKDATLGAILHDLDEGVLATDLAGNVVFANPAARAMLGTGQETGGALPDPWEDFDLPAAVARCAAEGECGEVRVRGKKAPLRVKLERMPSFDQHEGGVLVVVQDLSEGRRLEEVQQRFLINAAHELRTPLSTIVFAAELLATGADEDPLARRRFLQHILTGVDRMRRLSEAFLRLSRVGWDRREPELAPVGLGGVARAAADGMRPLAESAGLEIRVEGPSSWVVADPALLEEALLVLISNAIKHSDPGTSVLVRLGAGGSVSVEDRGAGIAREDLPHVFERYYVGEGVSEGFGLGLPICKELVEKMGGRISIRSERGVGTAVELELREAGPDA